MNTAIVKFIIFVMIIPAIVTWEHLHLIDCLPVSRDIYHKLGFVELCLLPLFQWNVLVEMRNDVSFIPAHPMILRSFKLNQKYDSSQFGAPPSILSCFRCRACSPVVHDGGNILTIVSSYRERKEEEVKKKKKIKEVRKTTLQTARSVSWLYLNVH